MQVPNVLDSLRNNEKPSYVEPIQWTIPTSEWGDDKELYARLRALYESEKSPESAQRWVQFMDTLRPIDQQFFMDFFTICPRQYQTPLQLEVMSAKKSEDNDIVAMQLLHRFDNNDPKFNALLRCEGCMQHLEIERLGEIAQHVWENSEAVVVTKHLPARIAEFLKTYPHALEIDDLPQQGVGLLFAAMIVGIQNPTFGVNIGDDERYYHSMCHNAPDKDVLKLVECLQRNSEWPRRMRDEFEMQWFEPFLQQGNPHQATFGMYQSLDPTMKLQALGYFLRQQTQPPAESYSLESISIS